MISRPLTNDAAWQVMASPIGSLLLVASAEEVTEIRFEGQWTSTISSRDDSAASAVLSAARGELDAYFAGSLRTFSVPCRLEGTTFQRRVWEALRTVPFGEVASYRDIAERVGSPTAVRAVGAANGRNPVPIIVPCHRVIGTDGSLTGFGGGLPRKQWLLEHEGSAPRRLI